GGSQCLGGATERKKKKTSGTTGSFLKCHSIIQTHYGSLWPTVLREVETVLSDMKRAMMARQIDTDTGGGKAMVFPSLPCHTNLRGHTRCYLCFIFNYVLGWSARLHGHEWMPEVDIGVSSSNASHTLIFETGSLTEPEATG
ncbi:mCG145077, partial [Mus musculus]